MLGKKAVSKAVKCEDWKHTRDVTLKGLAVKNQIGILKHYLKGDLHKCNCSYEQRWTQVYNHLNRMVKRGLIAPVYSRDLEEDRIEVLK